MIMEFGASVFLTDLGIAVLVNKKRLAGYLLGGVLLVVLLIGGYALLSSEPPVGVLNDKDRAYLVCTNAIQAQCEAGAGSVNLSEIGGEIGGCQGSVPPSSIRSITSVEDVNESTGMVTCNTSAANAGK
jgi:hypothetical protein